MNNVAMHLDKQQSWARVPDLASLIWAASAIDFMAQWYMGRAIWRLEVGRAKLDDALKGEFTVFHMNPMDHPDINKPLRVSGVIELGALLERNDFPVRLIDPWKATTIGDDQTMLEVKRLHPKVTMAWLSYHLADVAMDLFKRGATIVKAQYSMELIQICGNIGLEEREFKEFTNPDTPDYEAGDYVGGLP